MVDAPLSAAEIGRRITENGIRRLRAQRASYDGVLRELTSIYRLTGARLEMQVNWWDGVTVRVQSHNEEHQAK